MFHDSSLIFRDFQRTKEFGVRYKPVGCLEYWSPPVGKDGLRVARVALVNTKNTCTYPPATGMQFLETWPTLAQKPWMASRSTSSSARLSRLAICDSLPLPPMVGAYPGHLGRSHGGVRDWKTMEHIWLGHIGTWGFPCKEVLDPKMDGF